MEQNNVASRNEAESSRDGRRRNQLHPDAQPFLPAALQHIESEEARSLFMTFSIGLPLTREEITQHFMQVYGDCVEYVYVHDRRNNRDPEFGRIVFSTVELPNMILGREEVVQTLVQGRPLWLKRFRPPRRRNNH